MKHLPLASLTAELRAGISVPKGSERPVRWQGLALRRATSLPPRRGFPSSPTPSPCTLPKLLSAVPSRRWRRRISALLLRRPSNRPTGSTRSCLPSLVPPTPSLSPPPLHHMYASDGSLLSCLDASRRSSLPTRSLITKPPRDGEDFGSATGSSSAAWSSELQLPQL